MNAKYLYEKLSSTQCNTINPNEKKKSMPDKEYKRLPDKEYKRIGLVVLKTSHKFRHRT